MTTPAKKASGTHGPCIHIAICPGAVFCNTMATVFIEPTLTKAWLSMPDLNEDHLFLAVCRACKRLLPDKGVQAYSMLSPGIMVHGLNIGCDMGALKAGLLEEIQKVRK